MKTTLFTATICLLLLTKFSFGQSDAVKDVKTLDALNRPLIVVIQEENDGVIKQLKDNANQIAYYKELVATFNDTIKYLVEKNWLHEVNIDYKTLDEVVDMKKKEKDFTHAVLYISSSIQSNGTLREALGIDWTFLYSEEWHDASTRGATSVSLKLGNIEDFGKKELIEVPLPCYNYPNPGDIIFGLRTMNWCVENGLDGIKSKEAFEAANANASKIKKLTLILNRENVTDNFAKTKVSSKYRYKYKIVYGNAWEKEISPETEGNAYLVLCRIADARAVYYLPVVADPVTGEILAIVPITIGGFIRTNSIFGTDRMDESEMERLQEVIDGK